MRRLTVTVLLIFIQLLTSATAISLEARRVQRTFVLLTNASTCPTSVTHVRIALFRGINPSRPDEVFDGFLWDTLRLNNVVCQPDLDNLQFQSTFLLPVPASPPGTPPGEASPWFLQGRDNSNRVCQNFAVSLPASYFFTDDLPTFRTRLVRDNLLPPDVAIAPLRGVIYMFAVPASNSGDIVGAPCAYVDAANAPSGTPPPAATGNPATSVTPEPSPDQDDGAVCFPGGAMVATPRGPRRMSSVRVGDEVVTPRGVDHVVSFSHREPTRHSWFVRIAVSGLRNESSVLRMTAAHFLRVNGVTREAAAVRLGDVLEALDGYWRVRDVQFVRGSGLYAPVTRGGELVVDGVVVSCYTAFVGFWRAHALLAPVRAAFEVVGWDFLPIVDGLRVLALSVSRR